MAGRVRRMIKIGSLTGLYFEISPSDKEAKFPGLAWLNINVWLNETLVWSQGGEAEISDSEDLPVHWTWVDFLSGMARSWPWLMLENSYPIPVDIAHPGELQKAAQLRWRSLPNSVAEEEEDRLFDFKMCHDFSQYMRGIFLPPLWVVLEGADYVVWSPRLNTPCYIPAIELKKSLEAFGNFLAENMAGSKESRAVQAINAWTSREAAFSREFLRLSSGLTDSQLEEISAGYESPEEFFEMGAAANDEQCWFGNELLAAARMTSAYFPLKAQRILIEYVRQMPLCATPELDRLSSACPDPEAYGIAGYEQGYGLAVWLRTQLNWGSEKYFDCEEILSDWGVAISEVTLDEMTRLDALAVWGKRRGPAIFLNIASGTRSRTPNGRRTTLAHEICHLLCDRTRALPFAEVLGGQVPKRAEQRARAFAAELLMPRSVAEERLRGAADILEIATELGNYYRVSRELVMWQIKNSSVKDRLSSDELAKLENWAIAF